MHQEFVNLEVLYHLGHQLANCRSLTCAWSVQIAGIHDLESHGLGISCIAKTGGKC